MNTRRPLIITLFSITLLLVFLALANWVFAVHDQVFQLDGDISPTDVNPGSPGDPSVDWENLFDVVGNDVPTTKDPLPSDFIAAFFARDFVPGASGPDRTTFATGSKDTLNITPGWQCARDNNVNDKTDLVNVYATAYVDPGSGMLKLYFALERYSNEGAGNVAFWFLQDGTVNCEAPASGPSTTSFTGNHVNGDLLIVSEFTVGGTISSINAYQWVGGAGGFLDTTAVATGADCKSEAAGDDICATVNTVLFTPPWLTETKQPGPTPSNDLDVAEFFEGGINLTDLGLADRCFARVLADTRSSPSLTATIFDYAIGSLSVCDLAVTKDGETLSKVGDDVDYTITIENTGGVTLYKQSIVDSLLGDLTDGTNPLITSGTCGDSLAAGNSCTINVTRTVQDGDPDPLPNTVTVIYDSRSDLLGDEVTREDSHSVNLFQPSVTVDKDGDTLSKVGDAVTYTYTITNTSSSDSPDLILDSVMDSGDNLNGTGLGDQTIEATNNGCDVLPPGDSCSFMVTYFVQPGDDDPLDNTVMVHYHPDGFPNDITVSDSHSVNLFQPEVEVVKDGDPLSKVGDDVTYTFTIFNRSSDDSPNLILDADWAPSPIYDTLLGDLTDDAPAACDELTPDDGDDNGGTDQCIFMVSYTVQSGDNDPLDNTVTVHYNPDGFPNDISDSDDHSVNLFQPAIAVDKTGDELSKVGDEVKYTFTLSNNSSADTPDLECMAEDTLLGTIFDGVLPLGDTVINRSRTVQQSDPDPLENTVTLTCSPAGFPNVLEESDDHSVNLFQPAIAVDKTGDELSKVGDEVNYTFTLSNNSSSDTPDLECTAEDTLFGTIFDDVLPLGDTVINRSRTVLDTDPDPLDNTVTLTCSPAGFPNVLEVSDDHSVNLFQPAIAVDKTGDALSKVGDPVDYIIRLSNNSSADTPALNCVATDSLLGEVFNDVLPLGNTDLNLSRTVQQGDPDPLVNSVSMTCSVTGFPNVLNAGPAVHSTNLFQPAVEVIKTGPDTASQSETITYNFTINNLSSDDSPNLILDSVTDTVLGDLTTTASANGCGTLSFGGSCNFSFDYTIQATDPSPLVNVVTVHYHPDGFPNDITDDDDHQVEIVVQAEGCTPGFWQGGAGSQQWDEVDDPDWTGEGTNPFIHTTLFNDFFNVITDPRLDGLTMFDLVSSGGTSDSARRAARDMVAAYLNESAFPATFPADSLADLEAMWYAAVAGGDAALDDFHVEVGGWNEPEDPGFCPLP